MKPIVVATALALAAAQAGAVTVDDFSRNTSVRTATIPAGPAPSPAFSGVETQGGSPSYPAFESRSISATTDGTSNTTVPATTTTQILGGAWTTTTTSAVNPGLGRVSYDTFFDLANLSPSGENQLDISIATATAPFALVIDVFSETAATDRTFNLDASASGTTFSVPFSAFSVGATPTDFTNLFALTVEVWLNTGGTVAIDGIETRFVEPIPLPAGLPLALAGLATLLLLRRRTP
ncbi:MAG: hypothetical protein AAF675_16825 [Pseudomonadota bacterium]